MEKKIVIEATKRSVTGKHVKAYRREGKLPAVLYGKVVGDPVPLFLDAREAGKILSHVGSTSLLTINVDDGTSFPALVRERQRDVIYGNLLHVDFLAVSMTEIIRANVRIELVGEAPAVKEHGGILVTGFEALEIECLPQDLPEYLEVDISGLKEIGDSILVSAITIPAKVELLSDPDELIAAITAPMAAPEEEEEEVEEEGEPEVIERGKHMEEEEE